MCRPLCVGQDCLGFYTLCCGFRSPPQWMTESLSADSTVPFYISKSPSVDCAVPRSGFRRPSKWIKLTLIVDSTVTRSGFWSPDHGFLSLPQCISKSQLVGSAVPRCGLHSPSQWIPKSPSVDSGIPLGGLYNPLQWIAQPFAVDYAALPPPPHPLWRICQVSLSGFCRLDRKNSGRQSQIVGGFCILSGLYIMYYCFKTWDKRKKYLN